MKNSLVLLLCIFETTVVKNTRSVLNFSIVNIDIGQKKVWNTTHYCRANQKWDSDVVFCLQ